MSSSPLPPSPPEYAPTSSLLGPPLYSQDAASSEVLVEASQPPPPYPNLQMNRTITNSTATTNLSHTRDPVDYRCHCGNIEISLGPKVPGFEIASYGKGGTVRGTVTLKKHTRVERVVVSVCPPHLYAAASRLTTSPARRHRSNRRNPAWNASRQVIQKHSQSQPGALYKRKEPTAAHRSTGLSLRIRPPSNDSQQQR